jgi:hypothetical protein
MTFIMTIGYVLEVDCSIAHNSYNSGQEVTFSNLGLLDNTAYYLRVAAYNVENLYSENATSRSIQTDFTNPGVPYNYNKWIQQIGIGNIVFNFTATDTISGVQGFSTSVSRNTNIFLMNYR